MIQVLMLLLHQIMHQPGHLQLSLPTPWDPEGLPHGLRLGTLMMGIQGMDGNVLASKMVSLITRDKTSLWFEIFLKWFYALFLNLLFLLLVSDHSASAVILYCAMHLVISKKWGNEFLYSLLVEQHDLR